MMARFTNLVTTAAIGAYGVTQAPRILVHTAGWGNKLHFVISEGPFVPARGEPETLNEDTPQPARVAQKEPFLKEMLRQDGKMWKPIFEMARDFDFEYWGSTSSWT